ncbi:MAG: sigma-70 family RNA polymerase sigma factor [Rhodothermales bacterium]|nr:sigma-70 family RNA polymerase sigma factor [Rhodothermales bacterium]
MPVTSQRDLKQTEETRNKTASAAGGDYDLEALLRGDRAEFEELVRRESDRLFRVIVRIVRDDDEAASVMQETFLQAFERIHTFRGDSKLTTWLYAIGINLSRAALRKTRRTTALEEADLDRLQPSFSRGMYRDSGRDWDPQKLAEQSEVQRLVREAIDRLPEDYRVVVTLRDMQELPTAEVAQVLGISEGAVRVRLHRARQALKTLLDPLMR